MTAHDDLLAEIYLYVDFRWITTQLTTAQREMWADAIDANDHEGVLTPVDRWWSTP